MSKKTLVSVGTLIDYIDAERITPKFIEQARHEMRSSLEHSKRNNGKNKTLQRKYQRFAKQQWQVENA